MLFDAHNPHKTDKAFFRVVSARTHAPLQGEERAGVAPAEQEEEEAVEQREGQPQEQEEEEPRPAHQQGVGVPLCVCVCVMGFRSGSAHPTHPSTNRPIDL